MIGINRKDIQAILKAGEKQKECPHRSLRQKYKRLSTIL